MWSDNDFLMLPQAERAAKCFEQIKAQKEVFILNDADGCVMLTSDEEDGVPVWPSAGLAQMWANEEWSDCEPKAIDLDTWLSRWSVGLARDLLCVIVAPAPGEESEVMLPEDFAEKLL